MGLQGAFASRIESLTGPRFADRLADLLTVPAASSCAAGAAEASGGRKRGELWPSQPRKNPRKQKQNDPAAVALRPTGPRPSPNPISKWPPRVFPRAATKALTAT